MSVASVKLEIDIMRDVLSHGNVGVQMVSPSLFLPWPMAMRAPPGSFMLAQTAVPAGSS